MVARQRLVLWITFWSRGWPKCRVGRGRRDRRREGDGGKCGALGRVLGDPNVAY